MKVLDSTLNAEHPGTARAKSVAADRDEAKPGAGSSAASGRQRQLGLRLFNDHQQTQLQVELPGELGTKTDFLDILLADGIASVRAAIAAAIPFQPTDAEVDEFDQTRILLRRVPTLERRSGA